LLFNECINPRDIGGLSHWNETDPYDPVVWTARIAGDRVAEWRMYEDTLDNRANLGLIESAPERNRR